MRYRAVWDKNGLLVEQEGPNVTFLRADYAPAKRSDLAAPSLIRDQTEPFKSMADGKTYDSKSAYRETLRAQGLVELGNDAPLTPPKVEIKTNRRVVLHRQLADVSDRQADKVIKKLKKELAP
jgi:hypothetical protein